MYTLTPINVAAVKNKKRIIKKVIVSNDPHSKFRNVIEKIFATLYPSISFLRNHQENYYSYLRSLLLKILFYRVGEAEINTIMKHR